MTISNQITEKQSSSSNHTTETGLSKAQVLEMRKQYGENRLPAEKGTTVWTIC